MNKHILPLTYKPKIPEVLSGKCTQTIRPWNYSNQKEPGHLIMFHGWEGRPYISKWSFRTPYWEITEVIDIHIEENTIRVVDEFCKFHDMPKKEMEELAIKDGFENYQQLKEFMHQTYGNEMYDIIFNIIRWKFG